MAWAAVAGAVAGPLIGGLMGSEGNKQTQTNQNSIDPRMADAVYGTGGVLPSARDWYGKNSTGLNAPMTTGMDNQWQQLGASRQGFNQMQNVGMGLMGGGVAGNPFTGSGGIAPTRQSYNPAAFDVGQANPFASMNAGYMQQAQAAEQKRLADAEAARLLALQQQQFQPLAYDYGGRGGDYGGGGFGNGLGGGYGGAGDGMGANSTDGGFGGGDSSMA